MATPLDPMILNMMRELGAKGYSFAEASAYLTAFQEGQQQTLTTSTAGQNAYSNNFSDPHFTNNSYSSVVEKSSTGGRGRYYLILSNS